METATYAVRDVGEVSGAIGVQVEPLATGSPTVDGVVQIERARIAAAVERAGCELVSS